VGRIYIGIDGGGTQATALAVDEAGTELARAQGGAGLVRPEDPTRGAVTLAQLATRVLKDGGQEPPAAVLCCALAGAGRESARNALQQALEQHKVANVVRVTTDAEAALEDAFGRGPGILAIAGTGSIAWARTPDGRSARVGGWGQILGDEGSGYALAIAALRAAVRAYDGRGPETQLLPELVRLTNVGSPEGLIPWVSVGAKGVIAALAPIVIRIAQKGDAVAKEIVDQTIRSIVEHVETLYRKMSPWPVEPQVAFSGGLAAPGRPLRIPLVAALARLGLGLEVLDRPIDAARGAANLARQARAA